MQPGEFFLTNVSGALRAHRNLKITLITITVKSLKNQRVMSIIAFLSSGRGKTSVITGQSVTPVNYIGEISSLQCHVGSSESIYIGALMVPVV